MKNLISIKDLLRDDIELLIKESLRMKEKGIKRTNNNVNIASLFFENSTRTRVSFETAAQDLGHYINGFSGTEGTSVKKGEPLLDTLKMFEGYGYQLIHMRHGLEGSSRYALDNCNCSIVNGGDGANSHPTQTLIDLMTIKSRKGKLENLNIGLIGDLKYGRTVHSLLRAMGFFDSKIFLVSPESLAMSKWRQEDYKTKTGNEITISDNLNEVLKELDVLYVTRIQRERFPEGLEGDIEYRKVSGSYNINLELLQQAKQDLLILHPLPRYKLNMEISMDVNKLNQCGYYDQAANGKFMRAAIIECLLNERLGGVTRELNNNLQLWDELPIKNGSKKGQRMIYRLDNGTLIDHIEHNRGDLVKSLLGVNSYDGPILVANGIRSKRYGRKDVLAIHDVSLSPEQSYMLSLISEQATVNIIKNKRVVRKGKVGLPDVIDNLVQCQNMKCISRPEHYEFAQNKFYVERKGPLKIRCHYCEQPMNREEVTKALMG